MRYVIQIGTYDRPDERILPFLGNPYYHCILVEGNKKAYDKMLETIKGYNNFSFENVLISDFDGERNFYLYVNDNIKNEVFGHHSVYPEHLIEFGLADGKIEEVKMPCMTLETLCKKYGINDKEVDYLLLDTDCHDCDIILATDFSKLNISKIVFEFIHSDGTYNQGEKLDLTLDHLTNCGYSIHRYDESNILAKKI